MLLYELAIVLNQRSTDVVAAGAALGLGELQTATDLDPQQVAVLRAHFSGSGAPAAPPSWGAPTAPAQWGPPPGAALPRPPTSAPLAPPPLPPPLASPPLAPPPPPAPEAGRAGPYFAYPEAVSAPPAVPSGVPLVPGAAAPPPPPPPAGSPPDAEDTGSGLGPKLLIGGVVAAVIALFAFMALNTGPDEEREQSIAAKERELDIELAAPTTAPRATTTLVAPAPPITTPSAPDFYEPVDLEQFCRGGLAITTFELRLVAALTDDDFAELRSLVRDRRAGWEDDIRTMAAGAAPSLANDIALYQRGYAEYFDAISTSGSIEEAYAAVDRMTIVRASNAYDEFRKQVVFECE